jgi:alcohol dehydrogenase (cytochrome c)
MKPAVIDRRYRKRSLRRQDKRETLMTRKVIILLFILAAVLAPMLLAQVKNFVPVTDQTLLNPSPEDWLMFSRTYDAQRFSPLNQVNKQNVGQLTLAWSRAIGQGITETIPTVYKGVMYLIVPGGAVQAIDATTGDLIWEYQRPAPPAAGGGRGQRGPEPGGGGPAGRGGQPAGATFSQARSKTLAIYDDMIYYTAPDSYVVAIEALSGKMRWEAKVDQRGHTSGPIVVEGKVISGGTCNGGRVNCYISAHDAKTGKELWRFYTTQAPGEPPGPDTWAGTPVERRTASTWALPGSYDPSRKAILWGIANPTPNTRAARHGGNPYAIPLTAPADLYSNSTVAIDPETGKLKWFYQHLPGDDWDEDINEERTLVRAAVNPDPKFVKWINPSIPRGQMRDIILNVGEGGGIWALDRDNGQFLWAMPFPFDTPNFIISDIDVKTGTAKINEELILDQPGKRHTICSFNTRSWWPTAYHPGKNSLYIPYIDNCLDMTSAVPAADGKPGTPERRVGTPRPGADPNNLNGLAKVNVSTGEIHRWVLGKVPTNGAVLATAGDLIFFGDLNRRFRAFDADTGKVLWETILGAAVSSSTITYGVNGRQYIAVIAGDNLALPGLIAGTMGPVKVDITPPRGSNALYVFALPQKR